MTDDQRSFTILKQDGQGYVRTTRMPVVDRQSCVRIHVEKFVGGDFDIGFVPAHHNMSGWMRYRSECCGFFSAERTLQLRVEDSHFSRITVAEGDSFECFIDVDEGCARITKIDSEPLLTQEWRLPVVCGSVKQLYPGVSLRDTGSIVRFEMSLRSTGALCASKQCLI
eukprot:CAMPEP_0175875404 /NCGR_PEP_ID=MMETSP0107_2-20121207/39437_1 /TAXON_ID=195067 ORGANISM="Goniomonas pacifica, Strain CCMP1869" /NCGR_SAMPLE_ID=MMETSP0107_2 /ASSEMBLY_ACC=CAM_ASM_000203 /LENGTH=167 /DNA_ID=CAMNT_0017194421 /DNA_START=124 /DNA_END=627 /DNA_ORIENTATION=+